MLMDHLDSAVKVTSPTGRPQIENGDKGLAKGKLNKLEFEHARTHPPRQRGVKQ